MKTLFLVFVMFVAGCAGIKFAPAPPPTKIGQALPTPQNPLRLIKGLAGPIPKNDPATLDLYARNFDKLVFETERSGPDPWIRKWPHPIRYSMNWGTPRQQKIAARITTQLTQITGVTISDKLSVPPYRNVLIKKSIKIFGSDGECWGSFSDPAPDGSTVSAEIYIGKDFTGDRFEWCLTEEFSQLLGPVNDTTLVKDSLWRPYSEIFFLNDHTYDRLTWHDGVILRTLYDFRLKPGMHRDQALPIARVIIGELLAELNQ